MQKAGDEGVILVSFGTILSNFDESLLQMMADAFSKLPQQVIWKLELEGTFTDQFMAVWPYSNDQRW